MSEPRSITALLAKLCAHYSEPHRHYHTLAHIEAMLTLLEHWPTPVANREILQLAIAYHDVIYDPRRHDNERLSAAFAQQDMAALGYTPVQQQQVQHLILATECHQWDGRDPDCSLLLDLDLAILGADPQSYRHYAQAIRQEYAWVPEAEYKTARQAVLNRFLSRDALYFTAHGQRTYTTQAQVNLHSELAALRESQH